MGSEPSLIEFQLREEMAARLADFLENVIARAIAERGTAAMALSGGSTPEPLYTELSRRDINWTRVTAALVDERWVSPGAAGSNETFVENAFLKNRAASARLIGMWSDAATPVEGLSEALSRYDALRSPFDAVVLGMGEDGHTASWFPHCDGLVSALAGAGPRLAAIRAKKSAVTGDYLDRMTLTLGAIAGARAIAMLISGDVKRSTFAKALGAGSVEDMPVRAILRARPDLWACWAP